MTDLDEILGIMITLFVVIILGYVFFITLSSISIELAILFIIIITVFVAVALFQKLRGE